MPCKPRSGQPRAIVKCIHVLDDLNPSCGRAAFSMRACPNPTRYVCEDLTSHTCPLIWQAPLIERIGRIRCWRSCPPPRTPPFHTLAPVSQAGARACLTSKPVCSLSGLQACREGSWAAVREDGLPCGQALRIAVETWEQRSEVRRHSLGFELRALASRCGIWLGVLRSL